MSSINEHYSMGGVQHHIACREGDVGKYVLLPGDPGRVELFVELLDDARIVAHNREHKTMTGYYKGVKVSVTSTGMVARPLRSLSKNWGG